MILIYASRVFEAKILDVSIKLMVYINKKVVCRFQFQFCGIECLDRYNMNVFIIVILTKLKEMLINIKTKNFLAIVNGYFKNLIFAVPPMVCYECKLCSYHK